MMEKINFQKYGGKEKTKSGFVLKKQRYLCKNCGCNYTQNYKHEYSKEAKDEAISYYLEGIGFRRIERLLGMSHHSVINLVKQEAEKLKKNPTKRKKDRGFRIRRTLHKF